MVPTFEHTRWQKRTTYYGRNNNEAKIGRTCIADKLMRKHFRGHTIENIQGVPRNMTVIL